MKLGGQKLLVRFLKPFALSKESESLNLVMPDPTNQNYLKDCIYQLDLTSISCNRDPIPFNPFQNTFESNISQSTRAYFQAGSRYSRTTLY